MGPLALLVMAAMALFGSLIAVLVLLDRKLTPVDDFAGSSNNSSTSSVGNSSSNSSISRSGSSAGELDVCESPTAVEALPRIEGKSLDEVKAVFYREPSTPRSRGRLNRSTDRLASMAAGGARDDPWSQWRQSTAPSSPAPASMQVQRAHSLQNVASSAHLPAAKADSFCLVDEPAHELRQRKTVAA